MRRRVQPNEIFRRGGPRCRFPWPCAKASGGSSRRCHGARWCAAPHWPPWSKRRRRYAPPKTKPALANTLRTRAKTASWTASGSLERDAAQRGMVLGQTRVAPVAGTPAVTGNRRNAHSMPRSLSIPSKYPTKWHPKVPARRDRRASLVGISTADTASRRTRRTGTDAKSAGGDHRNACPRERGISSKARKNFP